MPRAGPAPGSAARRVRLTPTPCAMAAAAMAAMRREGNEHFQAGRYAEALAAYARALGLAAPEAGDEAASQRALLFRNRAACHLKLVSRGARRAGPGRWGGVGARLPRSPVFRLPFAGGLRASRSGRLPR